jgi:hypothetical protein
VDECPCKEAVLAFGGEVVMTDPKWENGRAWHHLIVCS